MRLLKKVIHDDVRKCPNLPKGTVCDVCGGSYICLESWRKKRTVVERIKERNRQEALK